MKITLLAKSSSGEPYEVDFVADGTSIRIFCHCQAGMLQQMCKHKLAMIKGDENILFNPKQNAVLSDIGSWPHFSTVKIQLAEYEKKLKEIETAKNDLTRKEKSVKAEFARGLISGFQTP